MSRPFVFLLFLLAAVTSLRAAEPEDPNVAMNAKLREALRKSMLDLRTAQTDLATAQAAQAAAEAKVTELTAKSNAQVKEAAADKAESTKKIEALTLTSDDLSTKLNLAKTAIEKWSAGYAKAVEVANAKEAERAKLADENAVLSAKVRDHKAQNLELYRLANEILTRYEKFSVGDALKAREPFTGVTRARLETQVQDYRDKAEDLRIPADSAKKPKPAPSTH